MLTVIQIAKLGLLLMAGALCGFLCWGIYVSVASERQVVADTHQIALNTSATLQAATETEQKVTAIGENVNGFISETRPQIAAALRSANGAVENMNKASAGLQQTIAIINAPCVPGPCGTLADVAKTLNTYRGTAGQVEAALHHENKRLDAIDKQEADIVTATKDDLTKLGGAIDGITALTANSDLKGSLKNLNQTTGSAAAMASDTAEYWHNMLHPKWTGRVWAVVKDFAGIAVKTFIP